MAQAGVWAPSSVIRVEPIVRVAGVIRRVKSMSWAGDTTGGLPDQVVSAGTGMRSRTGSIVWAQQADVENDPPHPMRRTGAWPPREGDPVVIDAAADTGSGPYSWRRFTGRIGRTTGSLLDGTLTSNITDTLGGSLLSLCTVPPIVSNSNHYMKTHWAMYGALAQAGLGAIPGPDEDTILWNGYQGGLRPLVGSYITSGIEYGDAYGLSLWTDAETAPDSTARASRDVLVIARAGTGTGSSTPAVKVTIGGRVVTLTYDIGTGTYTLHSTTEGTVAAWPRTGDSPMAVLAIQFRGADTRVYTSPTTYVSTTALLVPQSDAVTKVSGVAIAGASVRYMSGAAAPAVVARTAHRPVGIRQSFLEQERITATRGVENVTARSVVDAWSQATLASVWMDEHGKPWCVARDRLLATAPSRTVEVTERVFDGAWSIGDDSIRSRVVVTGSEPAIDIIGSGSDMRTVIYQESSARSFDAPAVIERFIEAPPDEEWGYVDLSPQRYGSDGSGPTAPARGTWIGAVTIPTDSSDDPELWAQISGVGHTVALQRLGQRTLLVRETLTNIPGDQTVYLRSALTGTGLHPAFRGLPSPTIRGEWKTTWSDYTLTGATEGPAWAEPLELDTDWWLTRADAQRVADALAAEVTTEMPTITRARVLWDPRRQIGDVEDWPVRDHNGRIAWVARVLVAGYEEAWGGNVPTQDVDVRVISMTDPLEGKTYMDLAAAYSTYSGMSGGTYQGVYDALPDSI